jgi:hypothetical protein
MELGIDPIPHTRRCAQRRESEATRWSVGAFLAFIFRVIPAPSAARSLQSNRSR